LQRGESIWINFTAKVIQSATSPLPGQIVPRFEAFLSILSMKTTITAESTSYNSVTPSLRLFDVMNQVVKSISGLSVLSPEFGNGGSFFDNRVFSGTFLRNITDKPFYVSLEDLEKYNQMGVYSLELKNNITGQLNVVFLTTRNLLK